MKPIALHHMCMLHVEPGDLLKVAAEAGSDSVCLFVNAYDGAQDGSGPHLRFPVVTAAGAPRIRSLVQSTGVAVANAEFFPISEQLPVAAYRAALEVAANIGARLVTTHIHDADDARATDSLGDFCDLAATFGLQVGLEFMGLTPACPDPQRAAFFIEAVGRPNIGIGVDVLHLVRAGSGVADIAQLPGGMIAYCQLCDGRGLHATSNYRDEVINRLSPGKGDFPILDLIAALPAHTAYDIEVPVDPSIWAQTSVSEHAGELVSAARELMAAAELARSARGER